MVKGRPTTAQDPSCRRGVNWTFTSAGEKKITGSSPRETNPPRSTPEKFYAHQAVHRPRGHIKPTPTKNTSHPLKEQNPELTLDQKTPLIASENKSTQKTAPVLEPVTAQLTKPACTCSERSTT